MYNQVSRCSKTTGSDQSVCTILSDVYSPFKVAKTMHKTLGALINVQLKHICRELRGPVQQLKHICR